MKRPSWGYWCVRHQTVHGCYLDGGQGQEGEDYVLLAVDADEARVSSREK